MSYKRFFLLLVTLCVLLACAPIGLSQETQTSGQVIDPRGFDWQAATGNFVIQCAGNSQPYINGSPVSRNIPLVRLDGTGSFSQALWDTSFLTDVNNQPLSCQWQANFVDNCGVATFSVLFTGITGVSVNVTSQISAVSVDLSPACTPPGILNSVTLSDLTPLFTVTKTGTNTDPIFTFNAISQAQGLFYASPASGSGLPGFRAIQASDLPAGTGVTGVAGTTNQISTNGTCCGLQTGNVILTIPDPFVGSGSVFAAGGRELGIAGLARFTSPGLNEMSVSSGSGSFVRFDFGPNTSSFPAVQRNGASLDIELADGSALTGLRSQTMTVAGLTPTQCVQASTGGLLTGTGSPCANGSGFSQIQAKIFTGCTTAAGTYTECVTSTQTWGTAFADSNYALTCTPFGTNADGGDKESYIIYQFTKTASNFSLTVQNNRGSTVVDAVEIDCTGVHP